MRKIKFLTNKKTIWRLVKNISYAKGNGATCEVYMKDGQALSLCHEHCQISSSKCIRGSIELKQGSEIMASSS